MTPKRTQIVSPEPARKALDQLLEGVHWPSTLNTGQAYTRLQDDTDGEIGPQHELSIAFSADGDAWVLLPGFSTSLRFRELMGGGRSPRTRNALLVLAEAIRRDNLDRHQH